MGRPLNKKYFGNRNTPPIGGEGVASVTLGTLGSYTTRPTVTFSAPDLASVSGVTATGTVTSEALSATVSAGGSGFAAGDLLNVTTAGGSAIAYVATVDGSGVILTVNFTGTGASRGSFEALGAATTTIKTSTAGTGTVTLVVTYRAKAVVITNAGSGYTDATDAAPTFTQSVTGTSVLTVTKENAIKMTAYLTGGSALAVDIIKQVSGRRYKVTDGTRTGIVKLKSSAVSAAGEASILATDSAGGTYYVTKLTAHRAQVTQGTGTQFDTDSSVPWTFSTATLNQTVKIPNS